MRLDPQLLAGLPFLATLSTEDREALALCFHGRGYAPNEVVFAEGDPASSMLIVAQGTLIATSRASGSREVGRFGPGQMIGEAALLDHAPRPVTLFASGAALVFELREESLETVRRNIPAAARALAIASLRSLLRRLRGVEEKVEAELTRTSVLW